MEFLTTAIDIGRCQKITVEGGGIQGDAILQTYRIGRLASETDDVTDIAIFRGIQLTPRLDILVHIHLDESKDRVRTVAERLEIPRQSRPRRIDEAIQKDIQAEKLTGWFERPGK